MRRRSRNFRVEPLECRVLLTLEGANLVAELFPDTGPATMSSDYGERVAIDGTTAVVLAPDAAAPSSNLRSGVAYVYQMDDRGTADIADDRWNHAATLIVPGMTLFEEIGPSIAIEGSTIVISARIAVQRTNDGATFDPTSYRCLVFTEPAGGWQGEVQPSAQLLPDVANVSGFTVGNGVAIDGDTIAMAGFRTTVSSNGTEVYNTGFMFEKPANGWKGSVTPSAHLVLDNYPFQNTNGYGQFQLGFSGTTVIASMVYSYPNEDPFVVPYERSIAVYERPGTRWSGAVSPATVIDEPLRNEALILPGKNPFVVPFGPVSSIAVGSDYIAVGMPEYDSSVRNSGAVAVFEKPANGWKNGTVTKKLLMPSQPKEDGYLGLFVSVSGTSIAATGFDPWWYTGNQTVVFSRSGSTWQHGQTENIHLASLVPEGDFSYRSSMAFDGQSVIVGVNGVNGPVPESGAVSIFRAPATGWSSTLTDAVSPSWTLHQPDDGRLLARSDLWFGGSVDIDGDFAVMSTHNWDTPDQKQVGAIWVAQNSGAGWDRVAMLQPSIVRPGAIFGEVAIDGNTVISQGRDEDGRHVIYIFEQPANGWNGIVHETAKLYPPARTGESWSSTSIAIDGDTIAIGNWQYEGTRISPDDRSLQPVAVYVRNGLHWTTQATPTALLRPVDPTASFTFGTSIAIDGGTIAVSSVEARQGTETLFPSAGYVFHKPAVGWTGVVNESARLIVPSPPSGASWNLVGTHGVLPIDVEGDVVAIGMTYDIQTVPQGTMLPGVLVYDRTGVGFSGSIPDSARLLAPSSDVWSWVKQNVDIEGDRILLAGANRIYERNGSQWTGQIDSSLEVSADAMSGDYLIDGDPYDSQTARFTGAVSILNIVATVDLDFGDAPDSYGTRNTTGASGGARHRVIGPILGALRDAEPNAGVVLDGLTDDQAVAGTTQVDDEDGVTISTLYSGLTTAITVTVSGQSGRLYGWVDFNQDGDFADANERIISGSTVLAPGTHTLQVPIPQHATLGSTYARFRLSTDTNLSWSGKASDGEVEDYRVEIRSGMPILIKPAALLTEPQPLMEWLPFDGTNQYEIWLLYSTTNTVLERNKRVSGVTYRPSQPLPIGNYTLFVRAVLADGSTSAWSLPRSFRIATPVSLLPAPERNSINPEIRWERLSGATSYDLWISSLTTGQLVLFRQGIPGTSSSWTFDDELISGQYRYWVRGKDAAGVAANWSVPQTFDLGLRILEKGFSTFRKSPTLSWNTEPTMNYEVYLAKSGVVIENRTETSPSWTPLVPLDAGTYRFWVRGRLKSTNAAAPWSSPVDFTTGGQTFLNPQAASDTAMPMLSWRAVEQAKSYRVQIVDKDTQRVILDQAGIQEPRLQLSTILLDDDYRVWARAESVNGSFGIWSPPMDFTVRSSQSSAGVILSLPIWLSPGVPQFRWSGFAGAVSYDFYLSNGIRSVSATNITETSYSPFPQIEPGDWTMWVRARDNAGRPGAWGIPQGVTVGSAPSLYIMKRSDNSLAEIRWLSLFGAAKYEVYIQNLGNNQVTRIRDVTLRNYSPAGTLLGGRYRVWVRALSQSGALGPWSQPGDFVIL